MPSRVYPINLTDFKGGLRLRGDAFELAENESPDMLNVDVDPRGGFYSRKGWIRWGFTSSGYSGFDGGNAFVQGPDFLLGGTAPFTGTDTIDANFTATAVAGLPTLAADWDPRTLFVHEVSDGTDRAYLTNDGGVLYSDGGTTYTAVTASGALAVGATPHLADFAPWGDEVYVACGVNEQSARLDSAAAGTLMTQAETGTWSSLLSPSSDTMPQCEFVASHAGYLFAAYTEEDGSTHPHRFRWSHPNNPDAWREEDYTDILEGGGKITGLVPMRDHLLIFKTSSVWALFGYSSDSWQLVNVSREVGVPHRQAITRSSDSVYFFSHPQGVYQIAEGSYPVEISLPLRPAFDSGDYNLAAVDNIWLGWINDRLWVSVPWQKTGVADDAANIFVYDPTVGQGAWVVYQGADGGGLGPFAHGGFTQSDKLDLACARESIAVMRVDALDDPEDDYVGLRTSFVSYYTTHWVDGGYPALKKSWRRPDLVVKERTREYDLTIDVFHDYAEDAAERSKTILVDQAGGVGALWGSFVWGDGTVYGEAQGGSRIEKGGPMGSAASVQLKMTGELERPWGVDAIVLKMRPRRFR